MKFLTMTIAAVSLVTSVAAAQAERPQSPSKVLIRDEPRQSTAPGFVRFTDPKEKAFSCEVPQGWRVSGGLERRSRYELRPYVRMTSPDGQIQILIGDGRIPSFFDDRGITSEIPRGQGSRWRDIGNGMKALVRSYAAGKDFAVQFAQNTIGRVQITQKADLPDLGKAMQATLEQAMNGQRVSISAGLATFKTARGVGLALSATAAYEGGFWTANGNIAFTCPLAREAEARRVVAHLVRTTLFDPKTWGGGQQGAQAVALNRRMNGLIAGAIEKLSQRGARRTEPQNPLGNVYR